MNGEDFARIANNFYTTRGIVVDPTRLAVDGELVTYVNTHAKDLENKYKIALVFICLNPLYWQFAPEMVQGAKQFLLPGHKTDFFFWTDIPEDGFEIYKSIFASWQSVLAAKGETQLNIGAVQTVTDSVIALRKRDDITIIPTVPVEWPLPTLLRYHLFLQEEQRLKDYDYIFYCDVDMKFVNVVGDEILGKGITAAQHPMYALKKEYWPPYEPNKNSASYIERPGKIIPASDSKSETKQRFIPLYYAGGFQGGKSDVYIQAMKDTKALIDRDRAQAYVPIWNDETAWNKYLSLNPPETVLSPSYIYPDSLIKEIYEPLWGCSYQPKLMTLTKWFSTSKEDGQHLQQMLQK
jgi:hypothetical protein